MVGIDEIVRCCCPNDVDSEHMRDDPEEEVQMGLAINRFLNVVC